MTAPESFEEELAARLERAGQAVGAEGVTRPGVATRHHRHLRARRLRRGVVAAVAAGALVVSGVLVATSGGGGGGTRIAAEGPGTGGGPASTAGDCAPLEVIVFLDPGIAAAQQEALAASLEGDPQVGTARFVSQAEAYEEARGLFADQPPTRDLLQEEDVPPSFRVTLVGTGVAEGFRSFVQAYRAQDGVREVVAAVPPSSGGPVPPSTTASSAPDEGGSEGPPADDERGSTPTPAQGEALAGGPQGEVGGGGAPASCPGLPGTTSDTTAPSAVGEEPEDGEAPPGGQQHGSSTTTVVDGAVGG